MTKNQEHPNPLRFKIENFADIHRFFEYLFTVGINFHPENDFDEYTDPNGNKIFDDTQIENLDDTLEDVWKLCLTRDVDIFSISLYQWEVYASANGIALTPIK